MTRILHWFLRQLWMLIGLFALTILGWCWAGNSGTNAQAQATKERDSGNPKKAPITKATETLIGGMKFVKVPKGTFWMGGGSKRPPTKQVEIKNDFYLGVYPVTQGKWQAVMGNNPSYFQREGRGKDSVKDIPEEDLKRFPVESVSWKDANAFIAKLNERERKSGWVYRLPMEAEWEYACRGGATSKEECSFDFYIDQPTNNLSWNQANFNGGFPAGKGEKGKSLRRTTKVSSYRPNKLGLYDMHGNVWQWCQELWPEGGSARVIRGGGWGSFGSDCAASGRDGLGPGDAIRYLGFRLLAVPSGK